MNKGGTYLVLGHSTSWIGPTQPNNTYSARIRKKIASEFGARINLVNKGIGGATSADLVKNTYWWSGIRPDFVTIDIGGNDCYLGQISVADFTVNVQKVIDKLKEINPSCLIMLTTMVFFNDNNRTPHAPGYRTAINSLATTNNLPVVHFENAYTQEQVSTYAPDGLHPQDTGHGIMADLLWTGMKADANILRWLNKLKADNQ